jgi:serine/threonine protein kinase
MNGLELGQGLLVAGRYRLEAHLGEGGMGTVWSALHVVTRRAVAMKFLRAEHQHRDDLRKRFLQEARAASALRHPNVIEVLDVFELEDHLPVMVMELLEGETLGSKLTRDERLSLEETAAIMLPVIDAVACAHAAGIVHRDLKPENIFLAQADGLTVKVLDFGIAKLSAEHYVDQSQAVAVTAAGSVLGTPRYMAPEQLHNRDVDHRADIWSLGTMLYECLSGVRPIEGENMPEVVGRLLSGAIMPLKELAPDLPAELAAQIQQMLARDPVQRPEDLGVLTDVLERYRARVRSNQPAARARSGQRPQKTGAPERVRASEPPRVSRPASRAGFSERSEQTRASAFPYPAAGSTPGTGADVQPRAPRARLFWIGAACVLLLGLGLLSRLLGGESSIPRLNVDASVEAMTPALQSAPSSSSQLERSFGSAEGPSASTEASTPSAVERAVSGRPKPAAGKDARKARRTKVAAGMEQAPRGATLAAPDEAALFSGRK